MLCTWEESYGTGEGEDMNCATAYVVGIYTIAPRLHAVTLEQQALNSGRNMAACSFPRCMYSHVH
jgi:hypothetical protein